jgi:hypothetical protein
MICWKCRKETDIEKPVRGDECPYCHADLHVCKACDFYENGSHNDCRESSAEFVSDKERSNFCDYFRPSKKITKGERTSKADEAKAAFDALFK